MGKEELIRYFTLTTADQAFLSKFRRAQNVLGAAVQLCALPWLGFVPDDVPSAPPAAVGRLARQLGLTLCGGPDLRDPATLPCCRFPCLWKPLFYRM
ncbi:DUF4158 domain-containing protein [Streptomyces sp. NPDC057611]|uniref:DUF4158 domain-containing protein n=1 Tax=Streptomyces sp. NPDC057611 TaxID=3346182 RepID=UPI0036CD2F0D